jgi:DNA-binding MarR family transcriptional regulator
MSFTMNPELSNDEVLILRALWELKALGNHTVALQDLAGRLSSLPKTDTMERLEHLETRGLVTRAKGAGDDHFALSPLGAAFVRQLQDAQLSALTHVS